MIHELHNLSQRKTRSSPQRDRCNRCSSHTCLNQKLRVWPMTFGQSGRSNGWPNMNRNRRATGPTDGRETRGRHLAHALRVPVPVDIEYGPFQRWLFASKRVGDDQSSCRFSVEHLSKYYAAFGRIYGAFLFCVYFELFGRVLRPGKAVLAQVHGIRRSILSTVRWPEMGLYPNFPAISEFPKWSKYLILLSFQDNSSARICTDRRLDVNICHSRGRLQSEDAGVQFAIPSPGAILSAISEFPKWSKYLILLSFQDNSSARSVQIGGWM